MNWFYVLAILFALGGILALLFYILLQVNVYLLKTGKHPALRKFIIQAIVMVYKLSDQVFDSVEMRLHWEQKQQALGFIYDMLPDIISLKIVQLKWKMYVSKAQFVTFVGDNYDDLVEYYGVVNRHILDEMIKALPSE